MSGRTVVWLKAAESDLASIWLASSRAESVTRASYEIDRDLRADAELNGTPLSEDLWVIERRPLRAVFEIKVDDRLVRVVSLAMSIAK